MKHLHDEDLKLGRWGENPGIAYRKAGIRDRIKHIVIPGIDHQFSVSTINYQLSHAFRQRYACDMLVDNFNDVFLLLMAMIYFCIWMIFGTVYMFLGWLFHMFNNVLWNRLINNSRTTICTEIKLRLLLLLLLFKFFVELFDL
jgi:fatty acid desaturase